MFNHELALAAGRKLIGLNFLHQGRDPLVGLDCSGLLIHMLHAGGWQARHPETTYRTDYPLQSAWKNIKAGLALEGYEIPVAKIIPLDILLMHWTNTKVPQHFAAVSQVLHGRIYVIHTHRTLGQVSEHGLDAPLLAQLHGAFRFYGRLECDPLDPSFNGFKAPALSDKALAGQGQPDGVLRVL